MTSFHLETAPPLGAVSKTKSCIVIAKFYFLITKNNLGTKNLPTRPICTMGTNKLKKITCGLNTRGPYNNVLKCKRKNMGIPAAV